MIPISKGGGYYIYDLPKWVAERMAHGHYLTDVDLGACCSKHGPGPTKEE